MNNLIWWGKQLIIGFVAVFFLITGINVLIASYSLKNPVEFIMFFFSASMLIMVSAVFILYPVIRIYYRVMKKNETEDEI
jgi:hypothetical protein